MGYSTNPQTLEKIRPKLAELEAGNPCRWKVAPGTASTFRYKILEAFYIAKLHATRYPKLAQASTKFSIKILRDDLVAAESKSHFEAHGFLNIEVEPAHAFEMPHVETVDAVDLSQPAPLEIETGRPVSLDGFQTEFTIISAWTNNPGSRSIYFPDAALTTYQLERLYKWAQTQDPKLMILQEDTGAGLTLAVLDPEVEEFAWSPEVSNNA